MTLFQLYFKKLFKRQNRYKTETDLDDFLFLQLRNKTFMNEICTENKIRTDNNNKK